MPHALGAPGGPDRGRGVRARSVAWAWGLGGPMEGAVAVLERRGAQRAAGVGAGRDEPLVQGEPAVAGNLHRVEERLRVLPDLGGMSAQRKP